MTPRCLPSLVPAILLLLGGCAKAPPPGNRGTGAVGGGGGPPVWGQVSIAATSRTTRTGTIGLNYWLWSPTFGDNITGTETSVGALAPRFLRIGGHNNDTNSPDPFTGAELDRAVTYARAVGAEIILQVPLLADEAGAPPTADTAAAMVTYANVTKAYGIKYFSIANEPDLYPDQEPTLPGFTPASICTSTRAFVTAMKAVDPSIKIVGPDLSWKYQPGNDWMTPILTACGELFDVVSFHRYPFAPTDSTAARAADDAPGFRTVIASVRNIMRIAGQPDKPLALTETNITYDGTPALSTLDASPGTVPAGLWTADMIGTALGEGLWSTLFWSVSEGWTLGLITPPPRALRPAYHAIRMFAEHFGPTLVAVTATPAGVRAYASRNAADTTTEVIVVNWNLTDQIIWFEISGTAAVPVGAAFVVGARTFSAVAIPDLGSPLAWTYGAEQLAAGTGAAPLGEAGTVYSLTPE